MRRARLEPLARSRATRPGCDGKGFCDFGCRTDARLGTNLSYVPAALSQGALCLTGARVERVSIGLAARVGVQAVTPTGRKVRVRGTAVILAGGARAHAAAPAQAGTSPTRSGQVGRNLSLHPSTGYAAVAHEPMNGPAHVPQGYGFDQFLRDGILMLAAQPDYNVSGIIFPFVGPAPDGGRRSHRPPGVASACW